MGARPAAGDPGLGYFSRALPGLLAIGALGYALNALVAVVAARLLGPADFGDLQVASGAMLVAAVAVGLGGPRAAGRFLPRRLAGSPGARRYLGFYGLAIATLTLLLAAAIWTALLADPEALPEDIHGHHPLSFVVVLVPVWAGLELLSQTFMATRRPIAGSLPARFVFPLAGLAMVGIASWLGWRLSDVAFVLLMALGGAVTLAGFAGYLAIAERARAAAQDEPDAGAEIAGGPRLWLALSLPMMGVGLLVALVNQVPLFVLALHGEAHAAGLFGAAFTLAQAFFVVITLQRQLYGPSIAAALAADRASRLRLHAHAQRQALLVVLPLALAVALAAEPLLDLFGPGFGAARTALWLLVGGLATHSLVALAARWLDYAGHQRLVLAAEGAATLAILAGSALVVPRYGVVGAAAVFAGVVVLRSLFLAAVAQRRLGLPLLALRAA